MTLTGRVTTLASQSAPATVGRARGATTPRTGFARGFIAPINQCFIESAVNGSMNWQETDRPTLPRHSAPPMQQHPTYGTACAALGSQVRHYRLSLGGEIAASALVLIRHWPLFGDFALLSRGPVWARTVPHATRRAGTHALLRQLRSRLRGVLATTERDSGPDLLDETDMLAMVSPGHIARLDLRGDAAARRARQHGKWRNRLVRAEAAGLHVTHGPMPADPSHWLLRRETAQAHAIGYRRLPASFTHAWAASRLGQATRLFVAEDAGRPVAAMLFLRHGRSASYHIGWSGPEGRRKHAHSLLMWQASNWLARQGHTCLDLGTLDTERTPGLARFKLGSGAQPVMLGATRLDAPGTALVARLFDTSARGADHASSSASQ